MQGQAEPVFEIGGYGVPLMEQNFRFRAEQQKVVHVADVAFHPQGVLDEVVQAVQVEVGEILTGHAANGQAGVRWSAGKGFVRWNGA